MTGFRILLVLFTSLIFAGCGEPERVRPTAFHPNVARAGEFDQVGTVTLYPGESCASQVVFVFHTANGAPISLAAPWHQSEILKSAARSHHTVRVVGRWRHGRTSDCTYIEATQVEMIQKSFW